MNKNDLSRAAAQVSNLPVNDTASVDGSSYAHSEDPPLGGGGISRRTFVVGAGAAATALAASRPSLALADAPPTQRIFRIHPAIGVARVGNADPDTYFIGPEAPGYGPLGSEPGSLAPPYKAKDGRLKPQAARFRIYEYAQVDGLLTAIREVHLGLSDVVAIRWTVHVANKKAAFYRFSAGNGESSPPVGLRNAGVADRRSLEIDFGPRTVSGAMQGPVVFAPGGADPSQQSIPLNAVGQPVIDYLGQLRTDGQGRLIVLGGRGAAGHRDAVPTPLASYANNDGWFDDVSDGPVTAVVTISDGGVPREIPVDAAGGAWVLCAPPDFVPQIPAPVSGYDLLLDLAAREIPVPQDHALYAPGGPLHKLAILQGTFSPGQPSEFPDFIPDFDEDIYPMLLCAYNLWYVSGLITAKHNGLVSLDLGDPDPAFASMRSRVFQYMRPPSGVPSATGPRTMPKLLGDNPYVGNLPDSVRRLPLTRVQFAMLRNWANGQFTASAGASLPPPEITPHGLDQAALEKTAGGAFFPGIEFGWQMRNASLFIEPFRLDLAATSAYWGEQDVVLAPGHFSRQMALPWHADFNDCRTEGSYGWWPSQRPTEVLPSVSASKRVEWARADKKWAKTSSSKEEMLANWYKFGLVLNEGDVFVEKERAAQVP